MLFATLSPIGAMQSSKPPSFAEPCRHPRHGRHRPGRRENGCLTALLGPNGAGKTTLISAVATLVKPDSGTLMVGDIDAMAQPQRVRPILALSAIRVG
jgi:hypothetical protein